MFADKLKCTREKLNYSQHDLAEISKVSQSAISAIEKYDRSPTESTMIMLANALNCSLAEMLTDNDKNKSDSYSADEIALIEKFRLLNSQGQDYILQTMEMAVQIYKKSADLPNVENRQIIG